MKNIFLFKTSICNVFTLTILGLMILCSTQINAQTYWNDPGPTVIKGGAFAIFHNKLLTVDGTPAVAFCDPSFSDKIRYMRAYDAKGVNWGSLILVNNNNFSGIDALDMEIINGNPAVANYDRVNKQLQFTRANNAQGSTWGTTVTVASGFSGTVKYIDLETVNGYPAFAYYDVVGQDLMFVRATDADGTAWGTPTYVATTGNVGEYVSLKIVNGNPAIAYYKGGSQDLAYIRATNADGTAWGTAITIASTGNVGESSSLEIVNGKPAIAYNDVTNAQLMYVQASDANGATWGTPIALTTHGANPINLIVANGNPGIGYYATDTKDLRYIYSNNVDGTSWGSSKIIDNSAANIGDRLSLAIIDGNPAMSYQDNTNTDLKYARSNFTTGLPVELTYFRGKTTKNGTLLTWQTASEENNDGFEVQRSTDGKEWQILDFVQGNGTTLETQNYDYLDRNPLNGTAYYRLKQMDFDDAFEYSNIIEITLDAFANDLLTIYPTVVTDVLNIQGGSGNVLIYNNLGQPVMSITDYNDQTTLNLSSLPNGQYFLRVQTPQGKLIKTSSFIKVQ